jgi:hypothetical protein
MELRKALLTKCQQQRFLSISRRLNIALIMDGNNREAANTNARHPSLQ